jgi:two-component system repressor protein LuxO
MAEKRPTVLLVEDTYALAETYRAYLDPRELDVHLAATCAEALESIERLSPSVIVIDVNLPDGSGLDLMRRIKERPQPCEVVLVTGMASVNMAVEAMREGAYDFIMKPFTAERLRVTLRNALERLSLASRIEELAAEAETLPDGEGVAGMIGRSRSMRTVYHILSNAAPTNATVFITGESGTGKELCAAAVHELSKRSGGPLITINCAAIPKGMLESEIFGHARGAFTGAVSDRLGAMLSADGGTLFLDEICEMELELQSKMLRVLQEKAVQRVGEDTVRPVDVRIVCATNRDPEAEVAAGRFREDLYYRLHVVPVELPPLREREEDVVLIARHFLQVFAAEDGKRFRGFSPDCEAALLGYDWPGNIRELQNTIRRAVVLNDGEVIERAMLPLPRASLVTEDALGAPAPPLAGERGGSEDEGARPAAGARDGGGSGEIVPLETVIRETIEEAVRVCGGNIPRAAQALQVSPSTVYRRIQAWSLETPDRKGN